MPLTQNWLLFALLSAVFASLTAILGKVGVEGVNSNFANFIRTAAALAAISAIVFSLRQWEPETVSRKTFLFLILSGVATGMSWLCYYHALKVGRAGNVAVVDKFSVVLVIILAAIFLRGEAITWRLAVAGVLITAGMLLIATAPPRPDDDASTPPAVTSPAASAGPAVGDQSPPAADPLSHNRRP